MLLSIFVSTLITTSAAVPLAAPAVTDSPTLDLVTSVASVDDLQDKRGLTLADPVEKESTAPGHVKINTADLFMGPGAFKGYSHINRHTFMGVPKNLEFHTVSS